MKEEEIRARLKKGIEMFEKGEPFPAKDPDLRIEAFGWRYAKRMQLEFQELVEGLLESQDNENKESKISESKKRLREQ